MCIRIKLTLTLESIVRLIRSLSVRPDEIATLHSFFPPPDASHHNTKKKWRVHWLQPKRENSCSFFSKTVQWFVCVLDPGDVLNLTNKETLAEGCRLWFNKDEEMLQFSVITMIRRIRLWYPYTYANAGGMCNFGSCDVWTVLESTRRCCIVQHIAAPLLNKTEAMAALRTFLMDESGDLLSSVRAGMFDGLCRAADGK